MNALELTSSLPHLPLPTHWRAAGQEPRGRNLQRNWCSCSCCSWSKIKFPGAFLNICFSSGKRQDNGEVKRAAREVLQQCVKGKYVHHPSNGGHSALLCQGETLNLLVHLWVWVRVFLTVCTNSLFAWLTAMFV